MTSTTSVSGITPSGMLTLGNYLGALRRFGAEEQRPGLPPQDGFYFVADLHAMTTAHQPARLARLRQQTALLLLAAGLAPGTVFVQSEVPAHAQLGYLLECTAYVGELSRMVQYKEKGRGRPMTRASLFTYPCLMAADILLYGARTVPVGGDQDQHVELARDLALRFNREYGQTFVVPELHRAPAAARVRDLQDPTAKMSKSAPDDAAGVIRLLDPPDLVRRKIARAVTDSQTAVRYDPAAKPGVSNLLEILGACLGRPPAELAAGYAAYGRLKADVAEAVVAVLSPLQARYAALAADPDAVAEMLRLGRDRAAAYAQPRLDAAMAAVGLGPA
ncbi:MAG TPA: tryptophan--tRNA ligase [Dermatophilaceae bacterium]|nr:tryptophan--tRNA ligase [Dermatophilaceae bacterium]